MQTSTTHSTGLGSSASFRELTPAETDHVSGGVFPFALLVAAAALAVMESCSDGDDNGGEQSED